MHPECITKKSQTQKHWLRSYMDLFFGKDITFLRIVPGKKKKQNKKNGFLVTAHEHHK